MNSCWSFSAGAHPTRFHPWSDANHPAHIDEAAEPEAATEGLQTK
jgi:hypothetical protein